MTKYIYIKADTNDADYVSKLSEITEEYLDLILPVIQAIKEFKPYTSTKNGSTWTHKHNYPYSECCRTDLGEKTIDELYGHLEGNDLFYEFVPTFEHGIHTIVEIKIFNVESEYDLL